MLRRNPIAFGTGLLALLAAYAVLIPPSELGAQLGACPVELAGMAGVDLNLDQAVMDDLDPDGVLVRQYERPNGAPLWLIVIYFENARLGAHDPHLCYRSQGFEVEELPPEPVPTAIGTIPLQAFRAARSARVERVNYFWYTSGQRAMGEVNTFRDRMFLQGLLTNRSFGAFVRVSTLEEDGETDTEALHEFIQQLAPVLPRMIPEGDS